MWKKKRKSKKEVESKDEKKKTQRSNHTRKTTYPLVENNGIVQIIQRFVHTGNPQQQVDIPGKLVHL